MSIPVYLAAAFRPYGIRLPKQVRGPFRTFEERERQKKWAKEDAERTAKYGTSDINRLPAHYRPQTVNVCEGTSEGYELTRNPYGDMSGGDFLYFAFDQAWGSVCRACGQGVYGKKGRRAHSRQSGVRCRRLLKKAYKLLWKDKNCVVCDMKLIYPSEERLGVPLHIACETRWKGQGDFLAVNEALLIAERNEE